jgi:peptidoglycan hydrolase CwlO-like protein
MKKLFSFIICVGLFNSLNAQDRDALNISSFTGYPLTIGDNNDAGKKIAFNKLLPMDVELDSMPRFQIGAIPNQTVWHEGDITVGFYVLTDTLQSDNVTLSYTIDFQPEGKITFNAQTGRFKYFPDKFDTRNFVVTFTAQSENNVIVQDVLFTLMPATPPEYAAFGVEPIKPLPPSTDDYTIIAQTIQQNVSFNNEVRDTVRSFSITGKELIFDSHIQNKLRYLSERTDIYELNIFAEKVIIRDALHFPQANVTIYAKELIFEDLPNQAPASLNTAPLMFDILSENTGKNGENAGNITLYIQDYKQTNSHLRFILVGGKGQNVPWTTQQTTRTPGNGGNGGVLTSTIEVSSFCDLIHGSAGIKIDNSNNIIGAGQHGEDGNFVLYDKEFNWLHPNFISAVVKHAKDAYLNVYNGFTYNIFEEYTQRIADYKTSGEWDELSDETKMELTNAETEMQAIIARISQNLDYFGNPGGWVPMLSFEVNKLAFEQEIGKAIRVMYLSYWLKNIEGSNAQRINACNEAINLVKQDLTDNKEFINQLVLLIPELQDDATALEQQINELIVRIEQKTQQLLSQAQHNVKKRNQFEKVAGVLSIAAKAAPVVCSIIPGVGTAVGVGISAAITTGLNYLSKATNVSDSYGYGAVAGGFLDATSGFLNGGGFSSITGALNQIDVSSLGSTYSTIKDAYTTINSTVGPLVSGIENLHKVFAKSSTPNNQVQAELDRLKAESREYQALIAETEVLNGQKVELLGRLETTFNNIATTSVSIQNNVLVIDGLGRDVFNGNSKRDLRAMQYLDDMERRAKERLLKYHYYMGKAYEYRLLQPYTAELNLSALVKSFTDIAEANPTQPVLNSQDFQNLKAVYEEQISTVTANILDMYNTNRPELSIPVRFSLTQEDKDALNSGASINLNIFERGMIPPYEENVRIVKFKIHDIQVHLEGNSSSFAYFDLLMEHSGISMMRKNGEIYYFDHINRENQNPIIWGLRYDANNGIVNTKEPSFASQSLLYSLLSDLHAQDSIMIYSRPGAWADIRISKNDVTSGNTQMVIDNLTFELQYDFVQRPTNNRNIDVYASDIDNSNMTLSPYMEISRADKSGRANGRGILHRTYNRNTSLTLEAPEEYGRYKFINWVNRYDDIVSTQKQVSVTLDNDTWVKANYRYMGAILNVPDSVFVDKTAQNKVVRVENLGSEEMEWTAVSNTPWIHIISDEGVDTDYLTLEVESNESENRRTGSITVTAPEAAEYSKEVRIVQSNEIVSGIESPKSSKDKITIFKQRESDVYSVKLNNSCRNIVVNVYTVNGQLVLRDYFYNTSSFNFDLSHYGQGVYLVNILYDNAKNTQKIIK